MDSRAKQKSEQNNNWLPQTVRNHSIHSVLLKCGFNKLRSKDFRDSISAISSSLTCAITWMKNRVCRALFLHRQHSYFWKFSWEILTSPLASYPIFMRSPLQSVINDYCKESTLSGKSGLKFNVNWPRSWQRWISWYPGGCWAYYVQFQWAGWETHVKSVPCSKRLWEKQKLSSNCRRQIK